MRLTYFSLQIVVVVVVVVFFRMLIRFHNTARKIRKMERGESYSQVSFYVCTALGAPCQHMGEDMCMCECLCVCVVAIHQTGIKWLPT